MKARDEIKNLIDKLASGSLPAEEPLFVLRAQDTFAADTVRKWVESLDGSDAPDSKRSEALELARKMDEWPVKRVPGCRPNDGAVITAQRIFDQHVEAFSDPWMGDNERSSMAIAMARCGMESLPDIEGANTIITGSGPCEMCNHRYAEHPVDWRVTLPSGAPFVRIICNGKHYPLQPVSS